MASAQQGDQEPKVRRVELAKNLQGLGSFADLVGTAFHTAGMVIYQWDLASDEAEFVGDPEGIYGSPLPVAGASAYYARVHPDDQARVQARIAQLAATPEARTPAGIWGETVIWRCQGFDGKLRSIRSATQVFADAQGKPLRLRGFHLDQTEQQASLDALREAQHYRDRIALTSPHMLYVFELASGKTLYQNRPFLMGLGYTQAESEALLAQGRSIIEYMHPEQQARLGAMLNRWSLAKDGEVVYTELKLRHKDGAWRTMLSADTVFERDAQGKVTQIVGVSEDVTERQSLQAQLIQAQKMESVGQLAGGIAHDFNNLLTVMQGYLREAHTAAKGDGSLENLLSRLELANARGAGLTSQLLSFARQQPLETRPTELNAWLKDCADLLRRAVGESVDLQIRPSAEPLWVQADPMQLEQMLLNLCLNSKDAMPDGGLLALSLETHELGEAAARAKGMKPGPVVCLSVQDSGHGMSEAVAARAVEPFFTTKPVGKGTGLGLSMGFGIMKQHGGFLNLESLEGFGTTITACLAQVAPPEDQAQPAAKPFAAHGSTTSVPAGTTVLLTEDLEDLRELLARLLKSAGYRVLVAGDGEEALQVAAAEPGEIHLLLTDLGLPKMNGRQLTERLLQLRPGIRVLATSGYAPGELGPQRPQEWLGSHGRFLSKPFNFDVLLQELRDLLA